MSLLTPLLFFTGGYIASSMVSRTYKKYTSSSPNNLKTVKFNFDEWVDVPQKKSKVLPFDLMQAKINLKNVPVVTQKTEDDNLIKELRIRLAQRHKALYVVNEN